MTIVLYDLVGKDDRRFSPYCWRTRMAIAHKELECDARPTRFTQIAQVADGQIQKIPAIHDGDRLVTDSFDIAEYLEDNYPDRPSLFGGTGGRDAARFFNAWVGTQLVPQIPRLVLFDIFNHIQDEDKAYFREAREKRFGQTLEQVQASRDEHIDGFRNSLAPARLVVANQPFLGGETPLYQDYQLFATLQWPRVISNYQILENDDPVLAWFSRCLDLHDGLGRKMAGYWG